MRRLKPGKFDLGALGAGFTTAVAAPFLMGADGEATMTTFQMILVGFAVTAGGIVGKGIVAAMVTGFRAFQRWTQADRNERNDMLGYIAGAIATSLDPEHKIADPAPPSLPPADQQEKRQ